MLALLYFIPVPVDINFQINQYYILFSLELRNIYCKTFRSGELSKNFLGLFESGKLMWYKYAAFPFINWQNGRTFLDNSWLTVILYMSDDILRLEFQVCHTRLQSCIKLFLSAAPIFSQKLRTYLLHLIGPTQGE